MEPNMISVAQLCQFLVLTRNASHPLLLCHLQLSLFSSGLPPELQIQTSPSHGAASGLSLPHRQRVVVRRPLVSPPQ